MQQNCKEKRLNDTEAAAFVLQEGSFPSVSYRDKWTVTKLCQHLECDPMWLATITRLILAIGYNHSAKFLPRA